ncbi:MAG: hypothetical protein ACM3KD_02770 [Hyphomicrobiaceae bacterium]
MKILEQSNILSRDKAGKYPLPRGSAMAAGMEKSPRGAGPCRLRRPLRISWPLDAVIGLAGPVSFTSTTHADRIAGGDVE